MDWFASDVAPDALADVLATDRSPHQESLELYSADAAAAHADCNIWAANEFPPCICGCAVGTWSDGLDTTVPTAIYGLQGKLADCSSFCKVIPEPGVLHMLIEWRPLYLWPLACTHKLLVQLAVQSGSAVHCRC